MNFSPTALAPASLIIGEPFEDNRGSFRRLYCAEEFTGAGLDGNVVQTNLSLTRAKGSVRGMHFQAPPSHEGKIVTCVKGAIFDVIIDLRKNSPTYLQHLGVELSADVTTSLYVPVGFAHGFQTLSEDAEVLYHMMDFYQPELSYGVRWNDPVFGILWPLPVNELSEKDAAYPDFDHQDWFA